MATRKPATHRHFHVVTAMNPYALITGFLRADGKYTMFFPEAEKMTLEAARNAATNARKNGMSNVAVLAVVES